MRKRTFGVSLFIGVLLVSTLLISQDHMFNAGVSRASIAVPGMAFHGDQYFQDYEYDLTNGCLLGGRGPILVAPIYFSPGYKTVDKIMMKFYDNNDSADLTVGLYRKDFITNQLDFVGMIHSGMSFQSPNIEIEEADLSGLLTKIENDRYAWFLLCEFDQFGGEPMVLHQVIVKYSK